MSYIGGELGETMPVNIDFRTVDDLPGVAVVTLQGSVDPKSIVPFQAALAKASEDGVRVLVLDLTEVKYINSAGMSYLVNVADLLAEHGGYLLVAGSTPKVKVVLGLMGVSQFFRLYKTVDSALAGVRTARRKAQSLPAARKHA